MKLRTVILMIILGFIVLPAAKNVVVDTGLWSVIETNYGSFETRPDPDVTGPLAILCLGLLACIMFAKRIWDEIWGNGEFRRK